MISGFRRRQQVNRHCRYRPDHRVQRPGQGRRRPGQVQRPGQLQRPDRRSHRYRVIQRSQRISRRQIFLTKQLTHVGTMCLKEK